MDSHKILELANKALTIKPWPPADLFPPSRYYRFLQVLAQEMQPSLSIELGVCGGGGSLHLAEGWKAGLTIGIDVAYDHPSQIEFIKQHCSNFRFVLGDSITSAKTIYEQYGPATIVFIDTIHEYQRTVDEFNAWKPYLTANAIVCLDDLFRPGMEDAWNDVEAKYKLRLDFLHDGAVCGGGFGVVWGFE